MDSLPIALAVIPLLDHRVIDGIGTLELVSLELWTDWMELRYGMFGADADVWRPLQWSWDVSDPAGNTYHYAGSSFRAPNPNTLIGSWTFRPRLRVPAEPLVFVGQGGNGIQIEARIAVP